MSSTVPYTRTLPFVLRDQTQQRGLARVIVAEVGGIPDDEHIAIVLDESGGITIPRLSGYIPTVGEPAYCLVADSFMLALGSVGGVGFPPFPPDPVFQRTIAPSMTLTEIVAGEDERAWYDTFTRTKRFQWVIPADWTSGDMTLKLGLRPFAPGVAVLLRSIFRIRPGQTLATIESGVNVSQTYGSTATHEFLTTIAAANFQVGDALRVDMQRVAGDGADTIDNHLGLDYVAATYSGH